MEYTHTASYLVIRYQKIELYKMSLQTTDIQSGETWQGLP